MIAYWAVPYLVVAAPPTIVLLTILIGGCTMTRTVSDSSQQARLYADADSRAGDELTRELDRRAARDDLRRLIEQATR